MTEDAKRIWDVLFSALQAIAVVIAACWAIFRFRRERTHTPHIEFDIDCHFYGPQLGQYIAEFLISAKNKGLVIHRFRSLKLRVRGISDKASVSVWEKHEPRISFPTLLVNDAEVIFKSKYDHIFVEPGVDQTISFVTTVPENIRFIVARVEFHYKDDLFWPHSAERVFAVAPSDRDKSAPSPA